MKLEAILSVDASRFIELVFSCSLFFFFERNLPFCRWCVCLPVHMAFIYYYVIQFLRLAFESGFVMVQRVSIPYKLYFLY